jgi:hypothetical protein
MRDLVVLLPMILMLFITSGRLATESCSFDEAKPRQAMQQKTTVRPK